MRHQASPAANRLRGANRPGELREKRRILEKHLLPAIGDLHLDQVDAKVVDFYSSAKHRQGLSASTVTNHLIVLKRMLNVAKRWGVISAVPEIATPKKPGRIQFLSFSEASRLLEVTVELRWKAWFVLAMRTGLRLGEMRALRWKNVDLENRKLVVEESFTATGFGLTKSGKTRTVPIAIDAAQTLGLWRPRKPKAGELVFQALKGGPQSHSPIHGALNRAAKEACIKKVHRRKDKSHSGVTPHMLRHTFASHAAMRGISIRQIQAWMGHASINQTMRYSHLAPEGQVELADRLAG